ncbi:hypothetical protein Tco_0565322 [Tanacetum coccineum]
MGESSTIPTDPHHTPTFIQPSTQPQKTQQPRKPKRKDTQVPQLSDSIENVADEAVHKELGDSLVRAAITVSSLEAEQESVVKDYHKTNMSTEVHQAAETVTTSNELDLLFGPLFDEYFNGENQVVLKSSAVTTTDASNKRQQQPDSTSSTSTLATTVTANGNFNFFNKYWYPTYTVEGELSESEFMQYRGLINDSLLARGNTLRSDEDRLKLDELKALCTTLQNQVFDLEKTKTTQHNEIASLKRRVKKLEKKDRMHPNRGGLMLLMPDEEITLVSDHDVNVSAGEKVFATTVDDITLA